MTCPGSCDIRAASRRIMPACSEVNLNVPVVMSLESAISHRLRHDSDVRMRGAWMKQMTELAL